MSDTDKKTDEDKFNDTLKRMLKTPPKPLDKGDGPKGKPKPKKDGQTNGEPS